MKQTLLRIGLPGDVRIYPGQFRELLAKQGGLPNSLFHYGSDNRPMNGMPTIRIVGAKTWVGILADEDGAGVVIDAMGPAVRAVMAYCGKPVKAAIEEHDLSLVPTHVPKRFWIREMVLKRRWEGSRNATVEDLVVQRLSAGIERMALHYGIDCPIPGQLEIQVDVTRHIGVPIVVSTGVTKEYATLVNAEFLMFAELKGYWFAGNLTSRGYGRIGAHVDGLHGVDTPAARRGLQ